MDIKATTTVPGLLFVWTDTDPAHEDDFNRWYDREHVAERVGVPGMLAGSRYRAADGRRRYLGLYRAESLDVFRSAAYQQVFQQQTPWSLTNLGRMHNTVRRVYAVLAETGAGTASWLVVARLGRNVGPADIETLRNLGMQLQEADGVIATRLLVPDAGLSTSLPGEPAEGRVIDPILLVEAVSEPVAAAAAHMMAENSVSSELATMQLLWTLAA